MPQTSPRHATEKVCGAHPSGSRRRRSRHNQPGGFTGGLGPSRLRFPSRRCAGFRRPGLLLRCSGCRLRTSGGCPGRGRIVRRSCRRCTIDRCGGGRGPRIGWGRRRNRASRTRMPERLEFPMPLLCHRPHPHEGDTMFLIHPNISGSRALTAVGRLDMLPA